jgi:cell division protein FtsW
MSKRWIKIATISFQPAEFAKLAVIIYLSWFLSKYNHLIRKNMLWVLYSLILPAITIFFILKQPHYGMAVIIFFTCIFLLFIAGAKILHILPIIGISIILSIILISNIDYMKRRIKGYLNPWKDSRDTGYQTVQSIICLGSGGLFGKGLGEGEGKLLHLPIPYSDSIFAIIGEEGGFIASCLILGLFLLYFLVGIKIAKFCIDNFGFFLTMGFICIITLQVIFNISVLTGLLPVTGLPLPFVSFGGSCLLASVAQTAILVNIYKVNKFIRDKKNTEI